MSTSSFAWHAAWNARPQETSMLRLAAAAHLALSHAAPAPPGAIRAQPLRIDAAPDARRILPPRAQARLDAVLERFDVIDGGIAWKMRW